VTFKFSDGYSDVIIVDKQANSVEFALMALLSSGDIVVTQDYGLADMALGGFAHQERSHLRASNDRNVSIKNRAS